MDEHASVVLGVGVSEDDPGQPSACSACQDGQDRADGFEGVVVHVRQCV